MKIIAQGASVLALLIFGLWVLSPASHSTSRIQAAGSDVPAYDDGYATDAGAEEIVMRRILGHEEAARFDMAAVSPDGDLLAGVDWGTGDIELRDLRRGETRTLTDGGWSEMGSHGYGTSFSPDGRQGTQR